MSVAQRKETGFSLFKRASSDVVLPRPYEGDHKEITNKTIAECEERSREVLVELAKI
ncbi:hypothetical protein [Alteromonas antoniana]|uniref:hypothetical protein n=1 Tax=Alteromonas antoniana TaxID=2803813 RepID=UPI001C4893EA|nr:hypothetical protein [Alteromonas antoniana]